jgi:hypothetical protein
LATQLQLGMACGDVISMLSGVLAKVLGASMLELFGV